MQYQKCTRRSKTATLGIWNIADFINILDVLIEFHVKSISISWKVQLHHVYATYMTDVKKKKQNRFLLKILVDNRRITIKKKNPFFIGRKERFLIRSFIFFVSGFPVDKQ